MEQAEVAPDEDLRLTQHAFIVGPVDGGTVLAFGSAVSEFRNHRPGDRQVVLDPAAPNTFQLVRVQNDVMRLTGHA